MNSIPDFGCHHFKLLLASSLDAPMSSLSFSASVRESDGMSACTLSSDLCCIAGYGFVFYACGHLKFEFRK